MSWSERIAIFGGSFDPPHLGHRAAVLGLLTEPGVREVWVTPTAQPAYRSVLTPAQDRLKMTEICFQNLANVRVDSREIARYQSSKTPTYTWDTLLELNQAGVPAAFVLGSDQLTQLHLWHRFPALLGLAHWIVLARKPDGEKPILSTLSDWNHQGWVQRGRTEREWTLTVPGSAKKELIWVETPAAALSSTKIREEIARRGQVSEGQIAPGVASYLMEHQLYGTMHPRNPL